MTDFTPEFIASELENAARATPDPWKNIVAFGSRDDAIYVVTAIDHYEDALREIVHLREIEIILRNHIKLINRAMDRLGPLVARACTKITPPTIGEDGRADFELARSMRDALDDLTEAQNKKYQDDNGNWIDPEKGGEK